MNNKKLCVKNLNLFLLLICLFSPLLLAVGKEVYVKGYFRSNGTYVAPHVRTYPDGIPWNNYSFPGNFNPNTGNITPGDPYKYLQRYGSENEVILDFYLIFLERLSEIISQINYKRNIENSFSYSYSYDYFDYFHNSQTSNEPRNSNKVIQKALKLLGYNPGVIDGIIGAKTKRAIKLFQKDHGLIPTGIIEELTANVMCDKLVGNLNKIKIIDGDTFLWEGEKIRIYGYDAPEKYELGYELAKIKLALLLSSGVITIEPLAKDKYGRTVARVKVNQIDISELLKDWIII